MNGEISPIKKTFTFLKIGINNFSYLGTIIYCYIPYFLKIIRFNIDFKNLPVT